MPETYIIKRTTPSALAAVDFDAASPGVLSCVRPESSDHRPVVRFALLHDSAALYLRFVALDRFVRVVHTGIQAPVYKDSCVEFFVQPTANRGYFNFEFNAGGSMQASYIEDCTRTPLGFKKATLLPENLCARIEIHATLPRIVEPEITTPLEWRLTAKIPLSVMAPFVGPLQPEDGTLWHGNFYKCADDSSHPHWLSWSPVRELNFHAPECFGKLQF